MKPSQKRPTDYDIDGMKFTTLPMNDWGVRAFYRTKESRDTLLAALAEHEYREMVQDQVAHLRGTIGGPGFRVISPPPRSSMLSRSVSAPVPVPKATVGLLPESRPQEESESDSVVKDRERKKSKAKKKNEKKKQRQKSAKAMEQNNKDEEAVEDILAEDGSDAGHEVVKESKPTESLLANGKVDGPTDIEGEISGSANDGASTGEKDSGSYTSDDGTTTALQYSPAESVRTEMTLVLGGDSDDEGASIIASPPSVPRYASDVSTAGSALIAGDTSNNSRVDQSIDSSAGSAIDDKQSVFEQSAGHHLAQSPTIVIGSVPIATSSNKADQAMRSDACPANEKDAIGNRSIFPDSEGGTTPPEVILVTPEVTSFSSFRKQNYPNPKIPAALMPMGTMPVRSISHGRSPLAAAPPITPSTLAWPDLIVPTRQNTPVPAMSTFEPGISRITIERPSSAEFIVMPEEVKLQQPATLQDVKLNHAYTLFTAHAGGALTPAAKGQAGLGSVSADLYSNDLVPIFTAHTFDEFFGSWKALRRAVSRKYGRPIEPEGSEVMAPLTEGLGIHLCPGGKTLQFFRQGVKPMWEDPMCGKGGKIMLSGKSEELDHLFFRLVISLVAGCFDVDCPPPTGTDNAVVGVVHSKREKHSRVEIWLGGRQSPPVEWVQRVEAFLRTDVPGQWLGYKTFHK